MTQPATPHPDHQEPEPPMPPHPHPDIIWATGPDILNPQDRDQLWAQLTKDSEEHQ